MSFFYNASIFFSASGDPLPLLPSCDEQSDSEDLHPTLDTDGERSPGSAPRFFSILLASHPEHWRRQGVSLEQHVRRGPDQDFDVRTANHLHEVSLRVAGVNDRSSRLERQADDVQSFEAEQCLRVARVRSGRRQKTGDPAT
jgi:hypothetical protein